MQGEKEQRYFYDVNDGCNAVDLLLVFALPELFSFSFSDWYLFSLEPINVSYSNACCDAKSMI